MPNNKVELSNGTVLIDLTEDTVTSEALANGYKAHDKAGTPIIGTAIFSDDLFFSDKQVNPLDWQEDKTYQDYPFRAKIDCPGTTDNHFPDVVFSLSDANSGKFSTVSTSQNDGVYIYASEKPSSVITLPTIYLSHVEPYAVISVTYPEGSICTCTNGIETLEAKDKSGTYPFLIPDSGVWTISCTDGTQNVSKQFVINKHYQVENAELTYKNYYYLFRSGDNSHSNIRTEAQSNASATINGTLSIETNFISGSTNTQCLVTNKNVVDISKYNSLVVHGTISSLVTTGNYYGIIFVANSSPVLGDASNNARYTKKMILSIGENQEYTLDISDIDDTGYFGLRGNIQSSISQIYLVS